MMKSIVQDLLTTSNGVTHDLGRWSWVASLGAVFVAAIWNAMHAATIDLMQLAQAIGVVVAAHGGALWAKQNTEPK